MSDNLVKRLREDQPVTQDMGSTMQCDLQNEAAARIEELEAEHEEKDERIEELQQACEVVSSEFEGELWQACRYLLGKTHFDFSAANFDGIQAADFQDHMNETLAEFDRAMARIAELEAKMENAEIIIRIIASDTWNERLGEAVDLACEYLAEIKGETP